ncbi:pre-mRNA-splicing factor rse1 [Penicillium chermesinum]|uniref:DNA damage-binding protein 1 n=1 Tax=Penicillium chermesinum TaxID=63820 RepID=A0A9W9NI91_9EURO|nr:pre-mRNA-splicing factor rse1 [Penicillium chermesinum]KAJ5220467.1 pre-mRNA-splicing factor rse1 [Penicillium chermesinum]KAJ6157902.1 pre-mRNA-splicing factor rse1 [Penicillium chermesinum]
MATTSHMFMYGLTIQPPTAITQAVLGQFAGTKEQQIITASGSKLSIHRPDTIASKVKTIYSEDIRGIIRSLAVFRLAGSHKDYLIIGSDSGRIAIVEYVPSTNRFKQIHLETFGKSGVRRVIPGQYLAADPKGRACMIASTEKNKLVYVLNRNSQAEVTISSPLEAHKQNTIVFAMTSLDVGYENPIFAALETDHTEADQDPSGMAYEEMQKMLVYYELDLGLNHVVQSWSEPVDRTANMLFQVPGGADGPSGVLVCAEDNITYRHSNQDPYRVAIPRRMGPTENPERKRTIVSGVMHRMRGAFFFLLQTEDGDIFKVTVEMAENSEGQLTGEVQGLKIKYFDTVPVASSLVIFKSGYLYVACESGDQHLYQFESLGDDDDETEFTSELVEGDPTTPYQPTYFRPRGLVNLQLTENIKSLSPLIDTKIANLADEDAPQIFSISGSGARSSFRTIKHGLEVSELVESELQATPSFVWTTKLTQSDEFDRYIVLSFANGTIVLGVGEEVVEMTEEAGFLPSAPTIAVQQLGEDSIIQVHPRGIRHLFPDNRVNEWPSPQHRTIVAASTNSQQVVVALSSGEIVYFELDADGSLAEYDERKQMSGTVTCLSLGQVPEGRQRSSFLAVGCDDSTVRILSLDPGTTLESKSIQALTAAPSALSIMSMIDSSSGGTSLYLHIGLHSGVYLRTVLDDVTGELSDTRTRFLGAKPVKLTQVTVSDQTAVLALSSRPWLGYSDVQTNGFVITPLNYDALEYAWNFTSEQCAEGMVGIQGRHLRIFSINSLGNNMLQEIIPLAYTPRRFVQHPEQPLFYVIESDNNVLSPATRERLTQASEAQNGEAESLPPAEFGYPRGSGHWASCIQIVDPLFSKEVVFTLEMEDNEAAVSVTAVPFPSQDGETFLAVGTVKDMDVSAQSSAASYIHIYRFHDDGRSLEFIHKTKVEDPPLALRPFKGYLLAGLSRILRLYDLGLKQLLRKCQAPVVNTTIVDIQTQGHRIVVSDIRESVTYVVYEPQENSLIPFVNDAIPRWTTSTTMVDYETVAGGDKFGNLWLLRCPQTVSEAADENGGTHIMHERGYLQGTPHRLDLMIHYYAQDMPTSVHKAQLVAGGQDILVWSGIQGTIGILVPFASREDVDFFQNLATQLVSLNPPLAGRDHLAYRSYYAPVKSVIDGDLCETFFLLPNDKKLMIAGELDRSVREIERKISDMRTRVAY